MAGKPRFTVEQVIAALNACNGLLYLAAERLGCSGQTVLNYMNRHARIRAAVLEKRGRRVDIAEAALDNATLRGEPWAVSLTLKTLGRDRGYLDGWTELAQRVDELEQRLQRGAHANGTFANGQAHGGPCR